MKHILDIWLDSSISEINTDEVGSVIPDEVVIILHRLLVELQNKSIDTGYGSIMLASPLFGEVFDRMEIPTIMTQDYRQSLIKTATHLTSDPSKNLKWKRSNNLQNLLQYSLESGGSLRFMYIGPYAESKRSGLYIELKFADQTRYILLIPDSPQSIRIFSENIFTENIFRQTLSQQGLLAFLVLIECTGVLANKLVDIETYWTSMINNLADTSSRRNHRVRYTE